MTREEERKKIIEYIRKVYAERGETPPVREINAVLGNNNHAYFHNHFVTIDEACLDAGVEPDLIRSRKTAAASLQRLRLQKKREKEAREATEEEEEDGEEEIDPLMAELRCKFCWMYLHWDENNILLCPNCLGYIACTEHRQKYVFYQNIDYAVSVGGCGCSFFAPNRQRWRDNLHRFDLSMRWYDFYPPGKGPLFGRIV